MPPPPPPRPNPARRPIRPGPAALPVVARWSRFWAGFQLLIALVLLGWVALLMWVYPVFALLIALCGLPGLVLLWFAVARLRDRAPVLVLDARGLTDRRPPLNGRTVLWREMRRVERGSNNRLLIRLHPQARVRGDLGAGAALDQALRSLTLDFGDLAVNIGGLSTRPGRLVAHAQRAVKAAALPPGPLQAEPPPQRRPPACGAVR